MDDGVGVARAFLVSFWMALFVELPGSVIFGAACFNLTLLSSAMLDELRGFLLIIYYTIPYPVRTERELKSSASCPRFKN